MVRTCPGASFAGDGSWWPDGDCGLEERKSKHRAAPDSAKALVVGPS